MKKENNFQGQLKGFPVEILEQLEKEQIKAGNPADLSVFDSVIAADEIEGGFNWDEEFSFWGKVLSGKDFPLFFARFPKKQEPVYPMWMKVGNKPITD